MTRKPDWADKICLRLSNSPSEITSALRAAERRGFDRALETLRTKADYPGEANAWALWLETHR